MAAEAVESIETLLVEDNPADVELTLHALRQNNGMELVQIQVARDGEEALDYLFGRGTYGARRLDAPLKLVLLDLKLPKVDGLEVLRAIKADSRLRVIPVVILTSSKEDRDLLSGYQLGVNSYIQKPVDFGKFREAVRQLRLYWLQLNQVPPALPSPAPTKKGRTR